MSCDVTQEVNSTTVDVDCSVTSLLLSAHSQVVTEKSYKLLFTLWKSNFEFSGISHLCLIHAKKVAPSPSTTIT